MEKKPLSLKLLRSFSPLNGLRRENLNILATKASLHTLKQEQTLFAEGDIDRRTLYLIAGSIELLQNGVPTAVIRSGSPEAHNPLAVTIPRRYTAVAVSDIEYLSIDTNLLDMMLTWDQTGSYEVSELNSQDSEPETGAADDWMTLLLQTKAFHKIPPANIQSIFMRMKRADYKAGELIIKQGDEGDYFYVIVKGQCVVKRESPINKDGIVLATLAVGDTFGEEALISDAKRSASVTAMVDATLMRLGKEDFRTLLNEPMLEWVDYERTAALIEKGAKWLDVRLPSEYADHHIEDSLNIPLYFLRLKLKTLDSSTPYIVCCDTGRRSSAAAYVLSERGYHAYVLRNGLNATDIPKK